MKLPWYIFPQKISWILLTVFFIFDNVFSYYAVTRSYGREANLLIAPLVEKFPWIYFLCIPTQIIIIYFIVLGLNKLVTKVLYRWKFLNFETTGRIILSALVIYWVIGNSFMNLSFLLGHRLSMNAWAITSLIGVNVALIYSFTMLYKVFIKNPN